MQDFRSSKAHDKDGSTVSQRFNERRKTSTIIHHEYSKSEKSNELFNNLIRARELEDQYQDLATEPRR